MEIWSIGFIMSNQSRKTCIQIGRGRCKDLMHKWHIIIRNNPKRLRRRGTFKKIVNECVIRIEMSKKKRSSKIFPQFSDWEKSWGKKPANNHKKKTIQNMRCTAWHLIFPTKFILEGVVAPPSRVPMFAMRWLCSLNTIDTTIPLDYCVSYIVFIITIWYSNTF